jgi:hypothetical protein
VSVYSFGLAFGALTGTTALGYVQSYFKCSPENPEYYGYTLAGACVFAYLVSIPLFLQAGKNYKEYKLENE